MPNSFQGFPTIPKIPWDDIYFNLLFESSDGYELVFSGSAYGGVSGWGLLLATGWTAGSKAECYKVIYPVYPSMTWNKDRIFDLHTYARSNGDNIGLYWMISGAVDNGEHIGFKIDGGKLYGTVADGAAESVVELEDLGAGAWYWTKTLRARLRANAQVEFYIDGVLKAVLTTNIPSGTANAEQIIYMSVENLTSANDKRIAPTNWVFFQET